MTWVTRFEIGSSVLSATCALPVDCGAPAGGVVGCPGLPGIDGAPPGAGGEAATVVPEAGGFAVPAPAAGALGVSLSGSRAMLLTTAFQTKSKPPRLYV